MNLKSCKLFTNTRIDFSKFKVLEYPADYTIAHETDKSKHLGIVLEGEVRIKAYTLAGRDFTMSTIKPGNFFGDILMFTSKNSNFPGSLITKGKTKIAFIKNDDFIKYLNNDTDLLKNFLTMISDKTYEMSMKSKLLSQDTVRDKIVFYLSQQKTMQQSNTILLNQTKEELANQLYMQRPSLSRELIKMKKEGLIDYDRWTITILQ